MRASEHKSGRLRRCAVLFLIAAFFLLPLVGCKHTSRQTMSSLWGPAGRRLETSTDATPPPKAEPSVSANVAASVATEQSESSDSDKVTTAESVTTRNTPSLQAIVGAMAVAKPTAIDRNSNADVVHSDLGQQEPLTSEGTIDGSGQEQLERLEAALDQDAEHPGGVLRQAGRTHDVRLRVESLLEKSRRLFDLGQFPEARHTAKIAHDLGDSARLDYAPDEERPIDLVLRIEDRIRETSEQGTTQVSSSETSESDSRATESMTANVNGTAKVSTSPTTTKPAPAAKSSESEAPNKPRKDWTQSLSVFGRGRKPTVPAQPNSTIIEAQQAPAIQLGLDTETAVPESNDGAVVQANRSLTLATTPPAASFAGPDLAEDRAGDTDANQREFEPPTESKESSVETASFDVQRSDLASDLRSWPTDSAASRTLQIEEPTPAPTDLQDVEPLTPFRDMAGPVPPQSPDADPIQETRSTDYGWPVGIALFAGCSIVAVFWYRRGAV